MDSASAIAIISVIASSVVALTGVVVPQLIAARKAAVDRSVAHRTWWRDKRVELYSDVLTFCARAVRSNLDLDDGRIAELEGRIGTAGSQQVGDLFSAYIEAAQLRDSAGMKASTVRLGEHIRNEVWQLSKDSGEY